MSQNKPYAVYLEIGKGRTFAGAMDWPGWCRSGRDEATALQSLLDYAPRYARIVAATDYGFAPPAGLSGIDVVERNPGESSTDFGVPGVPPACDFQEVDEAELRRLQALLTVSWDAFDDVYASAQGKQLRKGPRGGGREVDEIKRHVAEAQIAYLGRIGVKLSSAEGENADYLRQVVLDSLDAAVHHRLPERGPRGGALWKPRYFIRRVIWHIVDHAWEIEDRIL